MALFRPSVNRDMKHTVLCQESNDTDSFSPFIQVALCSLLVHDAGNTINIGTAQIKFMTTMMLSMAEDALPQLLVCVLGVDGVVHGTGRTCICLKVEALVRAIRIRR